MWMMWSNGACRAGGGDLQTVTPEAVTYKTYGFDGNTETQ